MLVETPRLFCCCKCLDEGTKHARLLCTRPGGQNPPGCTQTYWKRASKKRSVSSLLVTCSGMRGGLDKDYSDERGNLQDEAALGRVKQRSGTLRRVSEPARCVTPPPSLLRTACYTAACPVTSRHAAALPYRVAVWCLSLSSFSPVPQHSSCPESRP